MGHPGGRPSGPGKLVGRGIGCNRHPYGRTIWFRDRASAWLSLQADGTLLIRSGVTDRGAGESLKSFAFALVHAAQTALGLPFGATGKDVEGRAAQAAQSRQEAE